MSNFKALKKKYELKAQHKNLLVTEIDGTKAATMSDIFQILKKDLQFPAYFGENSDALFDKEDLKKRIVATIAALFNASTTPIITTP